MVLSTPCPYPNFTDTEWHLITRDKKPFKIDEPILPESISESLQTAAVNHIFGRDSYMYLQSSTDEMEKAAASTFNDL